MTGSEFERRNIDLRHTLDAALFMDLDSEDQSDGDDDDQPPSPSTNAYWNNLHQNALTDSGDESESSWPSSDGKRNHPQAKAKTKAASSQVAPKPKSSPSNLAHEEHEFGPEFRRAENRMLGIYSSSAQKKKTGPNLTNLTHMIARRYVHEPE